MKTHDDTVQHRVVRSSLDTSLYDLHAAMAKVQNLDARSISSKLFTTSHVRSLTIMAGSNESAIFKVQGGFPISSLRSVLDETLSCKKTNLGNSE